MTVSLCHLKYFWLDRSAKAEHKITFNLMRYFKTRAELVKKKSKTYSLPVEKLNARNKLWLIKLQSKYIMLRFASVTLASKST